jgi:nucleotide-binding universal stress UspA family protein
MQTLRHLVCGTDFSECAERGIELAITLALASRARVTLVHVCELGEADFDERRLLDCKDALSEAVARHRHRAVEVSGMLRSGKPWEKLDNVAAEVGAALIVIGRQGAGHGSSVEIGSVAEQLVRCASRPVLTVTSNF